MNLKQIRNELHMTQKAFAAQLGVPVRTLEGWEARGEVPQQIQKLINTGVWMNETLKQTMNEGDYETMKTTIETTEYSNNAFRNMMDTLFPGARERYDALNDDEKEKLAVQCDCDILNEDHRKDLSVQMEYVPVRTEDGWAVGRVQVIPTDAGLSEEEAEKRHCEDYCLAMNRLIHDTHAGIPTLHAEYRENGWTAVRDR